MIGKLRKTAFYAILNRFMRKKHPYNIRRILSTAGLAATCMVAAFTAGIRTAGDVQPVQKSQAALVQVMVTRGAVRGDMNGNGILDLGDAIRIIDIAEGLEQATVEDIKRGDINGDGILTVTGDALPILHRLATH